jgi:F-type H+-transporting ATPase subunit gamma
MASLRDLRRRIKSVEGIRQITRAMQMVAATKLRRAQQRIEAARPYTQKMDEILGHLSDAIRSGTAYHALLVPRAEVKRLIILGVASDKGLCGSYNSNVIRQVEKKAREAKNNNLQVELLLVGRKINDYFRRRGWAIRPESETYRSIDQQLPIELLQKLTDITSGLFLSGQADRIDMVYTEFKTAISQRVISRPFIPIIGLASEEDKKESTRDYIFEPEPGQLFSILIPKYARAMLFGMLADSLASEHGGRMTAMRNATKNAGEMIDTLTLFRNKARQAAITKELSEIVGGSEALRG